MWSLFSTFVCCFVSFCVYGNIQNNLSEQANDKPDRKNLSLPQKTSSESPNNVDAKQKKVEKASPNKEPIVVELSNSQIEEDDDGNENYVIKPSVAPATPRVFASSPSPSIHEIVLEPSHSLKSDLEPSPTSIPPSSSSSPSSVVVEEMVKPNDDRMFDKKSNVEDISHNLSSVKVTVSSISNVPSKELNLNVPPKELNSSVPPKELDLNVPPKEPNLNVPPKELNSNVPSKELDLNVPPKELDLNVPSKELNPNVPSKELDLNVPPKELDLNVPSKELNPNVPSKELNPNVPPKELERSKIQDINGLKEDVKSKESKESGDELVTKNKGDNILESKVVVDTETPCTTATIVLLAQQNKDGSEAVEEKKNVDSTKTKVDEKQLNKDDVIISTKDVESTQPTLSDKMKENDSKKMESEKSHEEFGSELKTEESDKKDDRKETEKKAKKDTEMLSFTEWKQKLGRQKEEVEEINVVDTTTNETVVVLKPKRKKKLSNKKNYASPDCGAKVVAANNEAQHVSAILKEDKDAYMLNPCNVQTWLVVELCERIQLDSIDFANFEMFSSSPDLFTVHVSNRYPTREWELVQEFHAMPGRNVQNFPIKDTFYAKYIKFEVVKYIGKEHYCPLSLLRAYGITEVEEYEDNHEFEHDDDATETAKKSAEEQDKSGYFESAKKAMVGLVNNVAETFTGKRDINETLPNKKNDIVTLVTNSDHLFEYLDDANFITTCIQRSLYSEYNTSLNPIFRFGLSYVLVKRMCPSLKIYRSLKMHHLLKPFNRKKSQSKPLSPLPPPPLQFPTLNQTQTTPLPGKVSLKPSGGSGGTPTDQNNNKHEQDIESTSEKDQQQSSSESSASKVKATARDSLHEVATTNTGGSEIKDTTCSKLKPPTIDITELVSQPSFIESNVVATTRGVEATTALKAVHLKGDNTLTESSCSKLESKESSLIVASSSSVLTTTQKSVDVLEFKTNSNTDASSMVAEKVDEDESTIERIPFSNVTKTVEDKKGDKEKDYLKDSKNINKTSEPLTDSPTDHTIHQIEKKLVESSQVREFETISASDALDPSSSSKSSVDKSVSTSTSQDVTSEMVQPTKAKQVQATVTSGLPASKESIIVKLNAKMKALELNLTMSMMYLDEMSEKYRTAVEEVDKRHTNKAFALNVSLNAQQDIIKHQTEVIVNLTKTIVELSLKLDNVTQTMYQHHETMTENHVFWIFVEIFLIMLFFLFCRAPFSKATTQPLGAQKEENSQTNRRKSEPVISQNKNSAATQKYKRSHSAVENIKVVNKHITTPKFSPEESDMCKRKKRKKLAFHTSKPEGMKETRLSNTAGLLFYAGREILSGLTGAFYGKGTVKASRQADALIDQPTVRSKKESEKVMKRAKSIDLPVVIEEVNTMEQEYGLATSKGPNNHRPKSADSILGPGKKHRNKMHQKSVGRFS